MVDHLIFNQRATFIACPTLLIWGEKDSFFPIELAAIPQKIIPNLQFISVARAGHVPHHERPIFVSRQLKKFIKQ